MGDRWPELWLPQFRRKGTRGHACSGQDPQADLYTHANGNPDAAANADTRSNQHIFAHGYSSATHRDACTSNLYAILTDTGATDCHLRAANNNTDSGAAHSDQSPCTAY